MILGQRKLKTMVPGSELSSGMRMPGDRKTFLRLQKDLIRLEKGQLDVLENEGFVTGLAEYLLQLYRYQYTDFAHSILHMLGSCTVCSEPACREKALFVLSLFADNVLKDDNDQALQTLSWIFSRWLKYEEQYLGCFEYVCNQIGLLLEHMLERGLFCQLMIWQDMFAEIIEENNGRSPAIYAVVSRMHRTLAAELRDYNPKKSSNVEPAADELACLKKYQDEFSPSSLIDELYQSDDKERRLEIIETLSRLEDDVAHILIEKLGVNAPWYAIRNAVQIITRLKSVRHYHLIKPFLDYPDVRVQKQVIGFISRLDRERALEQLLRGLEVCDDSLKFQIIQRLSVTGQKAAEKAMVNLLKQRDKLDQAIHDDIVLLLCSELGHFPSDEVSTALQELLEQWSAEKKTNDPIAIRADQTLKRISSK